MTGPIKLFFRLVTGVTHRSARLMQIVADEAFRLAEPRLSQADRAVLLKNEELRNRHQGRRAFIIANGASIRHQNLSPLADEITIVMSGFWKHPVVAEWQPSYYCFSDPVFFDGSQPMSQFFESLREHIHSTRFIVPLSGRDTIERKALLPAQQPVYYVDYHARLLGTNEKDGIDFTRRLPWFYTTAQLALMLAIYLGCSPVYLMGFDHDWLIFREYERHFYEGKTVSDHPVAHGTYTYPLDSEMESMLRLWKGYRYLKAFAETRNVKILNATDGGLLDVFDRVEFTSLFEPANAEVHI